MIILSRNKGFKWIQQEDTAVKGYFYRDHNKIEAQTIINEIKELEDPMQFADYASMLSGEFSFLIETERAIVAATDLTRSFPLYYVLQNETLAISDSISPILKLVKEPTVDDIALRELRCSGHCFGHRTLFKEIKTMGSHEILYFDKGTNSIIIREYGPLAAPIVSERTSEDALSQFETYYQDMIRQMIRDVEGKTLVVPIGISWWSRYLLDRLKKEGYGNVICYSYGSSSNEDLNIGKRLADYYGFEWYRIELTPMGWYQWFNSPAYREYRDFASNYDTVPNLQEFLAIADLVQKEILPSDAVFINDYCSNVMKGELIPKILIKEDHVRDEVVYAEIFRELASDIKWQKKDLFYRNDYILDIFTNHLNNNEFKIPSQLWAFQYAYWKESLSKYITNSRRTYEYFGFEWRNPQLNREMIQFWLELPKNTKHSRALLKAYEEKHLSQVNEAIGLREAQVKFYRNIHPFENIRAVFPNLYRRLAINKRSSKLEKAYDKDPMNWFNIISRREFHRFKGSITSITGVIAIKYIRDFCKDFKVEL